MHGISRLVIATAALVGMFVVILIYGANENDRMSAYEASFDGRFIEDGASLYYQACVSCHGANGEGLVGPALNSADLLIPEPGQTRSPRLIEKGWNGDLESFLVSTISSGRVGTVMPAWGQAAGGPYAPHQIANIAAFIQNWRLDPGKKWGGATDRVDIGGVEPVQRPVAVAIPEAPPSDVQSAELGRYLFRGPAGCGECHTFDGTTGTVGPELTGVVQERGRDYVYNSIVNPTDFGHDPAVMPQTFGFAMSEIEIQSIIDYLEDPEAAGPPLLIEQEIKEEVLPSGPEAGEKIASSAGCLACHSVDGSIIVGPTWLHLYGSTRKFTDGTQTIADDAYITTSIIAPGEKIVEGFTDLMPKNFGDTLTPEEIKAIIEYIASLQ